MKIYSSITWATSANGIEIIGDTNATRIVMKPTNITRATTGRTKTLTKGEISETSPDMCINDGKTLTCAANVVATISLSPSTGVTNEHIFSKNGAR